MEKFWDQVRQTQTTNAVQCSATQPGTLKSALLGKSSSAMQYRLANSSEQRMAGKELYRFLAGAQFEIAAAKEKDSFLPQLRHISKIWTRGTWAQQIVLSVGTTS
eukprot:1348660-Rhodomonas_salina.2